MSKMLGCRGIKTLWAARTTSVNRFPCKPAGVSSTTWVVPFGGLSTRSGTLPQLAMGRASVGRKPSHSRDDCCRSTSPSMTRCPWRAQGPATWVAVVDLPTPPLGLATTTTGMHVLLARGYLGHLTASLWAGAQWGHVQSLPSRRAPFFLRGLP